MRSLFLFIALIGTISCKRTADGDTNPATDDTAAQWDTTRFELARIRDGFAVGLP